MNMEWRARRLLEELHDVRDAAASLPDALVLLDAHGGIRWCNRSAERLLALAWPRDRDAVLASRYAGHKLGDWLDRGGAEPLDDVHAPADATMHLQVTMMPYGHDQRLLLARDISRLARLEQVRRDFVANVSHELRTPLTVIHGYLELLDPEDVPALAPVLGEMRAQSQRMRQIVEDLLALSRLEMERHLPEERVQMQPLLVTLRREAEALSQGRHRITLEDEAHRDLLGSAKDLHSAFGNLVSNAVRYTPDGGAIAIRWRRTRGGAEYSVTDTGYGIPAEHLSRLTERFYRVSSSRSRGSGGTGLGLSIVKHVLNLHHAELRIESEAGIGSTFACVFDHSRVLEPESDDPR
ncbi:MAG: phosphate regulon sensor histidine kinase PhoR [Xanthomonadales bacterium]|nr:phosphate regulon sensor histidine kinase PhoR [Xanthomonadales bacterium]